MNEPSAAAYAYGASDLDEEEVDRHMLVGAAVWPLGHLQSHSNTRNWCLVHLPACAKVVSTGARLFTCTSFCPLT